MFSKSLIKAINNFKVADFMGTRLNTSVILAVDTHASAFTEYVPVKPEVTLLNRLLLY